MSAMKRWMEDLSVVVGSDGEITEHLMDFGGELLAIGAANCHNVKLEPENKTIKFVEFSILDPDQPSLRL